jgi:predicted ester cyclase
VIDEAVLGAKAARLGSAENAEASGRERRRLVSSLRHALFLIYIRSTVLLVRDLADARRRMMGGDQMFELAQALAEAKSRQDLTAAMKLQHRDMVLETPAFGTVARGLAQNEQVLSAFFRSFPDYDVVLDGHANNDETLICWGTARMTMTGERYGVTPKGRTAEFPVFIEFNFQDDLIARERFFFDLSALCAQSGVSTDAVRRTLFGDGPESETGQPGEHHTAATGSLPDRAL